MLDENEFKAWLALGGAQTEGGRNSRIYAIRTIERNLAALGTPYQSLSEAWTTDQFVGLRERLKAMRADARSGGKDYRILMPDSERPHNRLSNWSIWLGQFGRFISGEPPSAAGKDADRIRQHVLELYIEPAREEGRSHVDVLVRDVNTALSLNDAWPNICQAVAGKIFQDLAQVSIPERIGADQSSATVLRFGLDDLATADAHRFTLFDAAGNQFQPVKNYNRSTRSLAYRIKPKGSGNKTDEAVETESMVDVARAMLIGGLASRVKGIAGGPVNYLTYGGEKLVRYHLDPDIAKEIGVPPNGFVHKSSELVENTMDVVKQYAPPKPTNLILYGPPGTGKTYHSAAEAVRLCGEPVPEMRVDLMAIYQKLLAAGRIEFVTFHQSMAYEEFIEGRQPMTGLDEGEDASTVGFRLETVPGIFRRIAKRAETSRGHSSAENTVRVDSRQVFKMSIGEASNPEDAHLFEEAVKGGYTVLGFEDIDWSDDKFANRKAFIEACKAQGDDNADVDARSGMVQMPFIFRNLVREDDLVIVSKGNGAFRAIGVFIGGYEFAPRPEGGYAHRRAVRWLWIDREGVPVAEIYSRRFSMKSIYLLDDAELNVPALERYMNSQRDEGSSKPEPFVLIIDEINRANISKVFGELISLLETDKRLGQTNQLKVRLPYSGDEFGVPSNLHVIGTMNTADRSIAQLDTALRRRFTFHEMMPVPGLLQGAADRTGVDLPRLLRIINERIEYLYDRDHKIGHAYFTGCETRADVDEVMRHKVIPLLAEYFFEDWAKIAAILGDLEAHDSEIKGSFLSRSVLVPPPGLDNDDAIPRFRWEVRSVEEGFDYAKLLGA